MDLGQDASPGAPQAALAAEAAKLLSGRPYSTVSLATITCAADLAAGDLLNAGLNADVEHDCVQATAWAAQKAHALPLGMPQPRDEQEALTCNLAPRSGAVKRLGLVRISELGPVAGPSKCLSADCAVSLCEAD